jgi:hypothetical protein
VGGMRGREAMTGGYRKLCSEKLCGLYRLEHDIRAITEDKIGGTCSTRGKNGKCRLY